MGGEVEFNLSTRDVIERDSMFSSISVNESIAMND
jgi:hypothetical protein